MSISVNFGLKVGNNKYLMEDDLSANFESYRSEILANENFLGAIFIKTSDGLEVHIEDELEAIVQNLCFQAVIDLKAGKNSTVNYFSRYGKLELSYKGSTVLIYGDFVPKITVPTEELLLHLYRCGQRFIDFFHDLKGNDPVYKEAIAHLKKHAELTRQVLAN